MGYAGADLAQPAQSDDADPVAGLHAATAHHGRVRGHARIGGRGAVDEIHLVGNAHQRLRAHHDLRPNPPSKEDPGQPAGVVGHIATRSPT